PWARCTRWRSQTFSASVPGIRSSSLGLAAPPSMFQIVELCSSMWNMSLSRNHGPGPAGTGVRVLDRAVAVLDAVEDGARTFTELVEATGFSRPTTHRIIKALEAHGYLASAVGYGYRLGPRLLRMGAGAMRELPLRDLAHASLVRLTQITGESAQLYVRAGDRRL